MHGGDERRIDVQRHRHQAHLGDAAGRPRGAGASRSAAGGVAPRGRAARLTAAAAMVVAAPPARPWPVAWPMARKLKPAKRAPMALPTTTWVAATSHTGGGAANRP